jgi:apoptosis-inducing factor 2
MFQQRQNVVVAGGGTLLSRSESWTPIFTGTPLLFIGFGANVARELAAKIDPAKYKVILINSLPYRIHLTACARLFVTAEGKLEDQAFLPYDRAIPDDSRGTFIQGTVTAIEKSEKIGGHVILENGERIPYRFLVLATGSKWDHLLNFPDDPVKVTEKIAESRAMFKNAKKVVIVGGG